MRRFEGIRVHGKSYALETLRADDRLLIVDDFCSGRHTAWSISFVWDYGVICLEKCA